MKKIHLIGIVVIAVAIAMLISAAGDVSTYASFKDAKASGDKVKVCAHLAKDKPMEYNPSKDPNYFSFYVVDNNQEEHKVVLQAAKPQDFELSEQIVITGEMKDDVFMASDMLMKCPSKYKDEEVYVKGKS